jgi:hypothetical protein
MQVFLVTLTTGRLFKVRAADVFACAESVTQHYGDWTRIESFPVDVAAIAANLVPLFVVDDLMARAYGPFNDLHVAAEYAAEISLGVSAISADARGFDLSAPSDAFMAMVSAPGYFD